MRSLTDGGDGGDDLSQFELIQDGRFTGGVEADHQNSHLLFAEEAREYGGQSQSHFGVEIATSFLVSGYEKEYDV